VGKSNILKFVFCVKIPEEGVETHSLCYNFLSIFTLTVVVEYQVKITFNKRHKTRFPVTKVPTIYFFVLAHGPRYI